MYTFRNLIDFIPQNFSEEIKANFIEKKLLKCLSKLLNLGYDLQLCFEKIFNKTFDEENFSETDIFFATHLFKLFNSVKIVKNKTKAYSKGVGMFCNNKNGFKENEFITGYYGEIYPPWYWYEKQDLIKSNKLDKELPDFYNIMLERLKLDKNGYDVIIVDPNSKGNFASRMSHSCNSNCNTVLMAANSQYIIGMYATKNIEFGEELTFNYNSVTEKRKEYQDAICLCGSYFCRGHYLIFSESMTLTEVLAKHHNFLHRNYILFKACSKKNDLTEDEKYNLNKYSIRLSILEGSPKWLRKWVALILEFIEYESKELPELLLKQELGQNANQIRKKKKETSVNNAESSSSHSTLSYPKKYKENKRRKTYNEEDIRFLDLSKSINDKKKNGTIDQNQNNLIIVENDIVKNDLELNNDMSDKDNGKEIIKELIKSEGNHDVDNLVKDTNNLIEFEAEEDNHIKISLDENKKLDSKPSTKDTEMSENVNLSNHSRLEFFKQHVRGITDNRIQNLAITIDKVKHVLLLLKSDSPPMIPLEKDQIFEYLYDGEDSIREILSKNFKELLKNDHFKLISEKLNENIKKIINLLRFGEYSKTYLQGNLENSIYNIKMVFSEISIILKKCEKLDSSKKFICYSALSDMLYLYSKTSTYFTHSSKYTRCESDDICIRKRDINTDSTNCNNNHFTKEDLDQSICKGRKDYDKFYIWGQLIGWFKQTVIFI